MLDMLEDGSFPYMQPFSDLPEYEIQTTISKLRKCAHTPWMFHTQCCVQKIGTSNDSSDATMITSCSDMSQSPV